MRHVLIKHAISYLSICAFPVGHNVAISAGSSGVKVLITIREFSVCHCNFSKVTKFRRLLLMLSQIIADSGIFNLIVSDTHRLYVHNLLTVIESYFLYDPLLWFLLLNHVTFFVVLLAIKVWQC